MGLETILLWAIIGFIAGYLANMVVGGANGILGTTIIGIVGSFLGGFLLKTLHVSSPLPGIAGTIAVAFLGACAFLLLLRVIKKK